MTALQRNAIKRIATLNTQLMQVNDRISMAGTQFVVQELVDRANDLTVAIMETLKSNFGEQDE